MKKIKKIFIMITIIFILLICYIIKLRRVITSTLGQQIKKIRESLGLTGEEFGKKLNVTKVAVSNWENNNRKPDLDMLVKIAKLGNTSVDSLLGLEKELSADSLKKIGRAHV